MIKILQDLKMERMNMQNPDWKKFENENIRNSTGNIEASFTNKIKDID